MIPACAFDICFSMAVYAMAIDGSKTCSSAVKHSRNGWAQCGSSKRTKSTSQWAGCPSCLWITGHGYWKQESCYLCAMYSIRSSLPVQRTNKEEAEGFSPKLQVWNWGARLLLGVESFVVLFWNHANPCDSELLSYGSDSPWSNWLALNVSLIRFLWNMKGSHPRTLRRR